MNKSHTTSLAVLLCLLPIVIAAEPRDKPDARAIAQLVAQLGDDDFDKREQAGEKLVQLGRPALAALRAAAQESTDAEVRDRAKVLVRRIEKDLRGELRSFGNPGSGYWLNRIVFSKDGKQALAAGGAVIRYDLETGRETQRVLEKQYARCGLALSRDGQLLATGHQFDMVVRLLDATTGKEVQTFACHEAGVFAVALSPDGGRLVSGGLDKTLRLWDAKTGKELRRFANAGERIRAVDFSPDGKQVISGAFADGDTLARLWDAETGKQVRGFKGHTGDVTAVAFLPDGKTVLSAGMDGLVVLWNAQTGKELKRMKHADGVAGAAVSPDGKRALTAGHGDHVGRLWDLTDGKEIVALDGHTGRVLGVAFSPDGKRALTCDSQCAVKLWRLPE